MLMLEGKRTYIGIVTTVLGAVGLGYLIDPTELGKFVDALVTVVGVIISLYGNYKAHKEIELQKEISARALVNKYTA